MLVLIAAPGCVFCSLDRTVLTISGLPETTRAVCPAASVDGRLVLMPVYVCKATICEAIDPWNGTPYLFGPHDHRLRSGPWTFPYGFSWRDGTRYGVGYETRERGWCAAWLPPDTSPRERGVPFFTCATARFDVTGVPGETLTPEQNADAHTTEADHWISADWADFVPADVRP
ncbi:MAG: hypothetical protein K8T90_04685 [Planctomycetes bacterium]|nr:hypothetical protein [Planctomycetota bacterium]